MRLLAFASRARTSFATAVLLLSHGCQQGAPKTTTTADGSQPAATSGPSGKFTLAPQTVGEATDGLTLRAVRQARHDGFHRFVFEFDGDVVPRAHAELRPDNRAIDLSVSGVRNDASGHRPLQREDGSPFGTAVVIDQTPVSSFGRLLVLDDSAVSYRIELTERSPFALHSLLAPTRVILDIETRAAGR